MLESGELLLEINAPSLFVGESQEAHAKPKTKLLLFFAQTRFLPGQKLQINLPNTLVKFT